MHADQAQSAGTGWVVGQGRWLEALAVVLDLRWIYFICAVAVLSGLLATMGQRPTGPDGPTPMKP